MKNGAAIKYSKHEMILLKAIPKNGKHINSEQLCAILFVSEKDRPWNARVSVTQTMRNLIKKVDHNKEPFVIKRTERSGPIAVAFWREER